MGSSIRVNIATLALILLSTAGPHLKSLAAYDRDEGFLVNTEVLFGYEAPPNAYHDDNGDYIGLLPDYLDEIERQLGVRFTTRDFDTWDNLMTYAEIGENFIVVGIADNARRRRFLRFTEPFISIPYVVVVAEHATFRSLDDIEDGFVCTVQGYAVNDYMEEIHPDLNLIHSTDNLEGLRWVSTGLADAMVINQMYATWLIGNQGITNLRIAADSGYLNELSVAVPEDDEVLFHLVNNAVLKISPETHRRLFRKWVSASPWAEPRRVVYILTSILLTLGFVVSVAFLWITSLRRQVNRQTAELEQSQIRLRTILDSAPVAIHVKNAQGRFLLGNPETARILEIDHSSLVGSFHRDLPGNKTSVERMLAQDAEVLRTGRALSLAQEALEWRDGSKRWLRIEKRPLPTALFDEPSVLGLALDITTLKETEESLEVLSAELENRVQSRTAELDDINRSLQASLEELHRVQGRLIQEQRIEALENMVAGVAHEMNTPLGNAIVGASYLVDQLAMAQDEGLVAEDVRRLKDDGRLVVDSLGRTRALLERFRQMAVKENSGDLELFDVVECVGRLPIYQYELVKQLHLQLPEPVSPPLQIANYPDGLLRVLTILLTNSARHGLTNVTKGIVRIGVFPITGGCRLFFEDNGRGLDPRMKGRLFDPFVSTARDRGFVGLGLSVAYRTVKELMGGSIECLDDDRLGLRFRIDLPDLRD